MKDWLNNVNLDEAVRVEGDGLFLWDTPTDRSSFFQGFRIAGSGKTAIREPRTIGLMHKIRQAIVFPFEQLSRVLSISYKPKNTSIFIGVDIKKLMERRTTTSASIEVVFDKGGSAKQFLEQRLTQSVQGRLDSIYEARA